MPEAPKRRTRSNKSREGRGRQIFIPPWAVTCGRYAVVALRWAHAISELTDPFWAAWCEGGSISELKGVFSLFTSEMSSETATLRKPLRWISELTSEEHSLK